MMVRVCLSVCALLQENWRSDLKYIIMPPWAPDTNSSVHHSGSAWTQNHLHCPGAFCIWCVMGETLAVSQTLTGGLSQWILTHVKLSYQTPSLQQNHDTYHHLPQQNTKRVSYLSPWPYILPWHQQFFSLSSIKPRPDYRHHFHLTSDAPPICSLCGFHKLHALLLSVWSSKANCRFPSSLTQNASSECMFSIQHIQYLLYIF